MRKLEERRLLRRRACAEDQRVVFGELTARGRALIDEVFPAHLENPGMLVPLYALLSRIRLGSSTDVIESGERVIATILKTYLEPNLSPEEIQSAASKHNDHLQEFSNTCRRELESLGQKI